MRKRIGFAGRRGIGGLHQAVCAIVTGVCAHAVLLADSNAGMCCSGVVKSIRIHLPIARTFLLQVGCSSGREYLGSSGA